MTAVIRFYQYGSPEVLKLGDEFVAAPEATQVRLKHEAIGVNFIDTLFRQGAMQVPLPSVPGVEGAGIVEAIGSQVKNVKVGDRVTYFLAPGSYAEYRLINADNLIHIPDDLSSQQVAAILTKGLTAWAGLNGFYRLQPGETILVQGASSNVGLLLSRWAKAMGATVIGTTGSAAKRGDIAEFIDHAFLADDPELISKVLAIAPNGVDVVYEFVGKSTFSTSVAAVRNGGVIVNIGSASGQANINQNELTERRIIVKGGPMATYLKDTLVEATSDLFHAYRAGVFGKMKTTIYPLSHAKSAHEDIAARRKSGPMILVP